MDNEKIINVFYCIHKEGHYHCVVTLLFFVQAATSISAINLGPPRTLQ